MGFKVARVGNMTLTQGKVGKIISGAASMSTDFPTGGSVSYSHNGQVIIYDERDIASEDDDPDSDDGLAVKPAIPGQPTPAEIARSNAIKAEAGNGTGESQDTFSNTANAVAAGCEGVSGNTPYTYQLSPNFKLSDLTTGCVFSHSLVAQHGLSVSEIICNLKGVAANYLEPLVRKYGRNSMIITSGFRPGSSKSQHELGMACDVQFSGITDEEYWNRAQWIASNIAYDQFILEYLGNRPWLHGSFSRQRMRKQVLTAVTNGSYVSGLKRMR